MPASDWTQDKNLQTRIYILSVDADKRQFNALDLNLGMVFSIEVNEKIDFSQIKKDKTYQVIVKVLKSRVAPELEKEWIELVKHSKGLAKGTEGVDSSGIQSLLKFELISLTPREGD